MYSDSRHATAVLRQDRDRHCDQARKELLPITGIALPPDRLALPFQVLGRRQRVRCQRRHLDLLQQGSPLFRSHEGQKQLSACGGVQRDKKPHIQNHAQRPVSFDPIKVQNLFTLQYGQIARFSKLCHQISQSLMAQDLHPVFLEDLPGHEQKTNTRPIAARLIPAEPVLRHQLSTQAGSRCFGQSQRMSDFHQRWWTIGLNDVLQQGQRPLRRRNKLIACLLPDRRPQMIEFRGIRTARHRKDWCSER